MKRKLFLAIVTLSLGLTSCVPPICIYEPEPIISSVTYMKNTLDYPIRVQCYFSTYLNDSNQTKDNIIPYSEPVELQPSECKIVMDYVSPVRVKIWRANDSTLLYEKEIEETPMFPSFYFLLWEEIYNVFEADNDPRMENWYLGREFLQEDIWIRQLGSTLFLKDDRYLVENIDWKLYPISPPGNEKWDEEIINRRKNKYLRIANGYAAVVKINLDKNAECFRVEE